MKKATTLELKQIKKFFPYHRICLVKVLLILIDGILIANSCNLNKIKKKASLILGKVCKPDTLYTRFIRFFKMKGIEGFTLGVLQLALSMALPYIGKEALHCIAIDRTNWKLGKVNINILYIGLVLGNGYFIPLYFKLLDKKGNSSQTERIDLFTEFKGIFNNLIDLSFVIVGDREFIGQDWFCYLQTHSYELVMRIRKKDYAKLLASQLDMTVERLNKKIARQVKKQGYCVYPIEIQGITLYYHVRLRRKEDHCYTNEKDKYIRFISTSANHEWVIKQYDKRWKIEVFFEDNKLKGFNLEEIGFTQHPKTQLMVAICAVCYLLCLVQGIITYQIRPARQKLNKANGTFYNRVSVFTKGYELIEQTVISIMLLIDLINTRIDPNYSINYDVIRDKVYFPPCQK